MKKFVIVIGCLFLLSGCAGLTGSTSGDQSKLDNYKEFMTQLPDHEFKKFEYHRNGVYSNANITALGALKEDGGFIIESIVFNAKYGPESVSVTLEGYSREFAPEGVKNE